MAKFSLKNRLEPAKREALLVGTFKGLASLRSPEEAARVLCDLLVPQELEMIAKRLAIACALLEGGSYQSIEKEFKVSSNTVARVNYWLQQSGEGFRLIAGRVKIQKKPAYGKDYSPAGAVALKRKYPTYYWPQAALEEIVKSADRKHLKNIRNILKSSSQKTTLLKRIDRLVNQK